MIAKASVIAGIWIVLLIIQVVLRRRIQQPYAKTLFKTGSRILNIIILIIGISYVAGGGLIAGIVSGIGGLAGASCIIASGQVFNHIISGIVIALEGELLPGMAIMYEGKLYTIHEIKLKSVIIKDKTMTYIVPSGKLVNDTCRIVRCKP